MGKINILFICGSVGLGHVTRDVAIADELRKVNSDIEISWLAASPARDYLLEKKEKLLQEAYNYPEETQIIESISEGYKVNLYNYIMNVLKAWDDSFEVFKKVIDRNKFHMIIGDEVYGIASNITNALKEDNPILDIPFIMIYDFIGMAPQSDNPEEKQFLKMVNQSFIDDKNIDYGNLYTKLFAGDIEDIPDRSLFGFPSENMRELSKKARYQILGNILRFNPEEYRDNIDIRKELGYGPDPLVLCTVGGTSIGKPLLNLCIQAYELMVEKLPDLKMVLVCGPKIQKNTFAAHNGIELKGFIPDLFKHLATSDFVITQCGGSTITELISLNKNFAYFPLEEHFEQQDIAEKLRNFGIGIEMNFKETTPRKLAEVVVNNIGKRVGYNIGSYKGAQKAAMIINRLLQ
jgi:UDP-N-acetylglucosamine:LPS N-acetylglucosamine transferase